MALGLMGQPSDIATAFSAWRPPAMGGARGGPIPPNGHPPAFRYTVVRFSLLPVPIPLPIAASSAAVRAQSTRTDAASLFCEPLDRAGDLQRRSQFGVTVGTTLMHCNAGFIGPRAMVVATGMRLGKSTHLAV